MLKINIRRLKIRYIVIYLLLISIFLLPSYFALDLGDSLPMFSVQRVLAIIATIACLPYYKGVLKSVSAKNVNILIVFYILTTYVSALLSGSVLDKTWLGIILEQILIFYLFSYLLRCDSSVNKLLAFFRFFALFLCVLGIFEYINGETFYAVLETTSREIYTGTFVRGNSYRIMGPFNHALAYGMVLSILFPVCCYDEKEKNINILKRWWLVALVLVNVFLTGSRSTILVIGLELFLIFITGHTKNKIKILVIGVCAVIGVIAYVTRSDSAIAENIRTIFYSLSDILFGTSLSTDNLYTASTSVSVRLNFLKLFFDDDINPVFGNGFTYSLGYSLDNNYMGIYIHAGWMGLLAFLFVVIYIISFAVRRCKTQKMKILVISAVGYCVHLFFVNELHTISILFIVLAMIYREAVEYCAVYSTVSDKSGKTIETASVVSTVVHR